MLMDFQSAAERIAGCVGMEDVAEAMGVSVDEIRSAEMNRAATEGDDWRKTLARLAREKAEELIELAEDLDPPHTDPDWESAYG